ncbi:MAG: DEAD/DEAH box helicase family protein [Polyangiaceae bacterium]
MMQPRPYQYRGLASVREQFRAGKKAVLLVAPTGSGKTAMGVMMALGHVQRGGRVIWLAHRAELRKQARLTLMAAGLELGAGLNASAPVQVCSIQALTARRTAPDGTLVIADEAHHMAEGNGWTDLIRGYLAAGSRIVGLTATPSRADGQALHGFDALVVAAQIRELTALGHLVPLRLKRADHALGKDKIAQSPVDAYLEFAPGRHAVVFAPHVKAAEDYAAGFRAAGIACEVVTGKTPAATRERWLDLFASGALPVLINVAVLTEGWDATICDCVILGRGCGSPGLLVQMVGRGLRAHPGKRDCLLIDLRGVTWIHGRPDADAEYSLDGQGIVLKGAVVGERMCKVCGLPLGLAVVCPECGKTTELVTPESVGSKLVDWDEVAHQAAKEQMKPNRAVLSLAGMIAKYGLQKGSLMFAHIFKRHPDGATVSAAIAFNRAKASAEHAFGGGE